MAMNVGTGDEDGPMMDINTTPLIDVMLVLLIMFIITIPIQTHAVKMNMPTPSNAPPPPKPPEIVRLPLSYRALVSLPRFEPGLNAFSGQSLCRWGTRTNWWTLGESNPGRAG